MSEYLPVTYDSNDCLFVKCMGYENHSALAHWGPGYRNHCILHYVVSGSGYFNGKKVCENQGFFISDNQLQEYHSDTDNPWNYFWIIFSKEAAEKYVLPVLKPDSAHIFQFRFKGKLLKMCQNIFSERSCLSHTQALSIFFHLISLHEAAAESCSCISIQHVQNAKLYIEYNFNKKITVSDVAEKIHVNERYLYNLFIKYEGISPKEYINQQRYSMACELLVNTHLSISEIAYSVGFPDVCTFSKFFAKGKKLSPTKYREVYMQV